MADAAKRPRPADSAEACSALFRWLRGQGGADIDGVEIRDDGHGGQGAFATRHVAKGARIAAIPRQCVLTLGAAKASSFGATAIAAGASEDMTMWMYIAHGREETSHPWHAYLSSLPGAHPDPTAWPEEGLAALEGTPLLQMVTEARAAVARELNAIHAKAKLMALEPAAPVLKISLERVLWGRGVHLSRCFPAELALGSAATVRPDLAAPKGEEHASKCGGPASLAVGCMLPLFDLLNHKSGHPVVWRAEADTISFEAIEEISPGDEVFNNYGGGKSNEDMLFFYGFAEADPTKARDVVSGMSLLFDFDTSGEAESALVIEKHRMLLAERIPCGLLGAGTLRLGPFELTDGCLVPEPLLRALAIVGIAEASAPPQLSLDMLDMLQQTLAGQLLAAMRAPAPPEEPAGRAASVTAYLRGRQRVLERALAAVEAKIQRAEAELEEP